MSGVSKPGVRGTGTYPTEEQNLSAGEKQTGSGVTTSTAVPASPGSNPTSKSAGYSRQSRPSRRDSITRPEATPTVPPEKSRTPWTATLEEKWQHNLDLALDRMREALMDQYGTRDAKDLAVAAGIATEKHLLLSGKPTAIVAGLTEHRHEIGPIMARMARLAAQLPTAVIVEAGDARRALPG